MTTQQQEEDPEDEVTRRINEFTSKTDPMNRDYEDLIGNLTEIFLDPKCTDEIFARYSRFFPSIVARLSRAVPRDEQAHRANCLLLARALALRPDLLTDGIRYFERNPAPFSSFPENFEASAKKRRRIVERSHNIPDRTLLLATNRLLALATHRLRALWDWSELYEFLKHSDTITVRSSLECFFTIFEVPIAQRARCLSSFLPQKAEEREEHQSRKKIEDLRENFGLDDSHVRPKLLNKHGTRLNPNVENLSDPLNSSDLLNPSSTSTSSNPFNSSGSPDCSEYEISSNFPRNRRNPNSPDSLDSHFFSNPSTNRRKQHDSTTQGHQNLVDPSNSSNISSFPHSTGLPSSLDSQISTNFPSITEKRAIQETELVLVASTQRNLRSLSLAATSGRACVCVEGPVGSGKTSLVEHLAQSQSFGPVELRKVQLGEETDSKLLLGSYRCGEVPGEFFWEAGILTNCALRGSWILLEDVDASTPDVASVLEAFLESKVLRVPGFRENLRPKAGFRVFLTKRSSNAVSNASTNKSLTSLLKNCANVVVEPPSDEELVEIVRKGFPVLSTVAKKMVGVFSLFGEDGGGLKGARVGRRVSMRDLIKWCKRAEKNFDVSSVEDALRIFQDAVDLFCCSIPDPGQRLKLSVEVAHKLGIVGTKAEYYVNVHKPSLEMNENLLAIGRAKLSARRREFSSVQRSKSNFSATRSSLCLLERISVCVAKSEPVLLVGETGTGKTSAVQHLAHVLRHRLVVINMSQQSETSDLLGGYKPVDLKILLSTLREDFELLFRSLFAIEPNKKFLDHVSNCFEQKRWSSLLKLMSHSCEAAIRRLKAANSRSRDLEGWRKMGERLQKLKPRVNARSMSFAFVEGSLVKALKNGDWILLDEINLANAETLEFLSGVLQDSQGSVLLGSLLERGDDEPLRIHPDFRLFACMNPASDVGKKDLPTGVRNRFTEFFVEEMLQETDLQILTESYLKDLNLPQERIRKIVKFYLKVKNEAHSRFLDGTGHKPHFSLRTLCRALVVASKNPCGNIKRSIYEAFAMSFLTQLDKKSYQIVEEMIQKMVFDEKKIRAVLKERISKPKNGEFVEFEGYWVPRGTAEPEVPQDYILTDTVRRNLKDLVRVVSIGKMPVLLQGDTSVGKTSLISYLAKSSGHKCVRINNHEHTDLQEYVGSYVADAEGTLVFREGMLVEAMRKGHWIILDELNLAPSDVLEALNRVLDDNRELFLPETQEVVKAHENFMLFATQNPPGLYGGRKVLSRAFRNRFVELHFDEIPSEELKTILQKRCQMPESYCKQVISVMTDLQIRRKSTATFAGKKGFMTLRDLFRWAERYRLANVPENTLYDWSQHLADEGYLLLSAKIRRPEENFEIIDVLKKHLKREVDPASLFTLTPKTSSVTRPILELLSNLRVEGFEHVVWTQQMRRLFVLLTKSTEFNEPVLLVGETGGGKTTICQILAKIRHQQLEIVNCHLNTEAADFLGSLRPVRERTTTGKLFEWVDGPLLDAMNNGGMFLADEISLADDSVLERLNSLLEPERKLLVPEKPEDQSVLAQACFVFVGTMNPGGDFGKKELSPALRNRFTEIWCEVPSNDEDFRSIILHNLEKPSEDLAIAITNFLGFLRTHEVARRLVVSVRDVLTWVEFINRTNELEINVADAFFHGACLGFIDGLGSGLTGSESLQKLKQLRASAERFARLEIQKTLESHLEIDPSGFTVENRARAFGIAPFFVENGPAPCRSVPFVFSCPTTNKNALKVLRALQLRKPILLEGSPGVGKTSLVASIAQAAGHRILRINLSDQTDISDLFGSDLPVEGGRAGEFSWRDGPFLRALRSADWILLDELNLASQSILEGLNACLDHRHEVYVPELRRSFKVDPRTRIFGCQNPLREGGARRGLPKSFLNRFTQVFVDPLEDDDLLHILEHQYPSLPKPLLLKMIELNSRVSSEAGNTFAHFGAPWEMNLRDVVRWCDVTMTTSPRYDPKIGADLIYVARMRTNRDKQRVREIYGAIFADGSELRDEDSEVRVTCDEIFLGDETLKRNAKSAPILENEFLILREQKAALKNLARCARMNWLSIVVGESGCGKSSLVRLLADLAGEKLKTIVLNSATDTSDILGGFEQTDYNRHFEQVFERAEEVFHEFLRKNLRRENLEALERLHRLFDNVRHLSEASKAERTTASETKRFLRKLDELSRLVSELSRWTDGPETVEIAGSLEKLQKSVETEKSLNAGGKFEWVDSPLVECVRNGGWLLLDQVNLCSPAVLDRLNGLLEPNGTLTIGEKGVDQDGNLLTLEPHENFRLFLALDPRYGEISRAMRNRGVEIAVACPRNLSSYNSHDVRSLLHINGIAYLDEQEALLSIHQEFCNESFGLIELLQAAFSTGRQVERGCNFRESLQNACQDVYGSKGRISREEASRRIQGVLEQCDQWKSSIDVDGLSINSREVLHNWQVAAVKQQGFLMRHFDEFFRSENAEKNFATFFKTAQPTNRDVSRHLLHDFYERSSIDDLPLRRLWIAENLKDLEGVSEELVREINALSFPAETPLTVSPFFNNISIVLFMKIWMEDENLVDKPKSIVTLRDYATAVSSGKLTSKLKNEPLITDFVDIVAQSKTTIDRMIKDGDFVMNDDSYAQFRENVAWLRRFEKLGNMKIVKSMRNSRKAFDNLDEISSSLELHFNWLIKFFRKCLQTFCRTSGNSTATCLQRHLDFLFTKSRNLESTGLKKVRKFCKSKLHAPKPHSSESAMKFSKSLHKILKKFEIRQDELENERKTKLKILFLQKDDVSITKTRAIDLFANRNQENFTEEEFVDLENSLNENSTVTDVDFSKTGVEFRILPILEAIFSLIVRKFEKFVCEEMRENLLSDFEDLKEVFSRIIEWFQRIPTIPARLLAQMKMLNSREFCEGEKILWFFEFLVSTVEFEKNSFSKRNSEVLLRWNARKIAEDDCEVPSTRTPKLVDLILDLLLPTDSLLTLRNHRAQKRDLQTLRDLLWRNCAALTSKNLNSASNDEFVLRFLSKTHFDVIQEALNLWEREAPESGGNDVERRLVEILRKFREFEGGNAKERGIAWLMVGLARIFVFCEPGAVDPVHKVGLKLRYLQETQRDFESAVLINDLQNSIVGTSQNDRSSILRSRIQCLVSKSAKMSNFAAQRSESEFLKLREEIRGFFKTVGSPEMILRHVDRFSKREEISPEFSGSLESKIWENSLERFSRKLESFVSEFPDLVSPILVAISCLRRGISILTDEKDEAKEFDSLETLLKFPRLHEKRGEIFQVAETLLRQEDYAFGPRERIQATKIGLQELENVAGLMKFSKTRVLQDLDVGTRKIRRMWQQQEHDREEKLKEDESLFKVSKSQEEEEEEDFFLFSKDFEDEENNKMEVVEEKPLDIVSTEDAIELFSMHRRILEDKSSLDLVDPFLKRFHVLRSTLKDLQVDPTSKIAPSLVLLLHERSKTQKSESKKTYDFYRDPNIPEAESCEEILQDLRQRVLSLLQEWPENPMLCSIMEILERILDFDVSSPLSRFLIGLETLMPKIHQWEENARSDVSLMEFLEVLGRKVLDWRKLEASRWKDALDVLQKDLKDAAAKWWFFLFDLLEEYSDDVVERSSEDSDKFNDMGRPELNVDEDEVGDVKNLEDDETEVSELPRQTDQSQSPLDSEMLAEDSSEKTPKCESEITAEKTEKLIESLQTFLSESPIIEFDTRLSLIFLFHLHFYKSTHLSAILYNVYNYYSQFQAEVAKKLTNVRVPCEKRLRELVKISRWRDTNIHSVKDTSEKARRAIQKVLRELRTGYQQKTSHLLAVKPISEHQSFGERSDVRSEDFLVEEAILKGPESSVVLRRARDYCQQLVQGSVYENHLSSLEDFVEDTLKNAQELRETKTQKKSEAKILLQRKKLALADFFKTLRRLGLSYRLGVAKWRNKKQEIKDFGLPAVKLEEIRHFGALKSDKLVLNKWKGCDKYYFGSLIRMDALQATLQSKASEIGRENSERCSGFSVHLLYQANRQRKTVVEIANAFLPLRIQILGLVEIKEQNSSLLPRQEVFQNVLRDFEELLSGIEINLRETRILMEIPVDFENSESFDFCENAPKMSSSDVFEILETIDRFLEIVKQINVEQKNLTSKIQRLEDSGKVLLFGEEALGNLRRNFANLRDICTKLSETKEKFVRADLRHPIAENFEIIIARIHKDLANFDSSLQQMHNFEENPEERQKSCDSFEKLLNTLKNEILIVIQEKIRVSLETTTDLENKESEEEEFEENFFTEVLVRSLRKDIKGLRVKRVSAILDRISSLAWRCDAKSSSHFSRLLDSHAALFHQYLHLVQFYIHQQVSTHRLTSKFLYLQLNVFLDLATNGFCVPKDLDAQEGEENDQSQGQESQGGMGLTEGEGKEDVSDRIENEDQLEDAKRPEDRENQPDNDQECDEEDKGIEMSENFEGQLQDIEKNLDEDEKEEEEEDDEDLEDEIGETEENSKQLDEEMWKDDEEGEKDEEDGEQKEEKGSGKQTSDEELSAKEKEAKEEGNEDNKEKTEDKKKEINEMEEPEESEDHIDPYHGKQQPEVEPEPMDLPEDLNLDEDAKEDQDNEQEDPFDIDQMKESKIPEDKPEEEAEEDPQKKSEESKEENGDLDSSEDEGGDESDKKGPQEDAEEDAEENAEESSENKEQSKESEENLKEDEKEDKETEENRDGDVEQPDADVGSSKEVDRSEQVTQEGGKDAVESDTQKNSEENECPMESDDKEVSGVGQSEAREDSGHGGGGNEQNLKTPKNENLENPKHNRRKPGKSDDKRSLLNENHPPAKKLKMVEERVEKPSEDNEDQEEGGRNVAESYEHVEKSEKFDEIAMDAATEEQTKVASNLEDQETEEDKENPEDTKMDVDEVPEESQEAPAQQKPEETEEKRPQRNASKSKELNNSLEHSVDKMKDVEVEGEVTETSKVPRGEETTFHTRIFEDPEPEASKTMQISEYRREISEMLGKSSCVQVTEESRTVWGCLSNLTEQPARDLAEKLRLVLEPTKNSRLKGDYRTGRRINMRKIIPYIASEFRKDKIWLRRSKPSKRDYQVVLAVDDSSSMADNQSKELAFESLALIGKALGYLEVGQLSVISFGERVDVLHRLGENFDEESGARLIQEMRFDQKRTMVSQLVDFTVEMLESQCDARDSARLLAILSDGRGIFSEGIEKVNAAVRRAKMANVFLVFVIVDNPINKDSILDIRMPVFESGKLLGIRPYMDSFPFPFYIILRDLEMLPVVLSDALRQWFEIVGRIDQ